MKSKLKKIIGICLTMVLTFSVTLPAYAEPDDKETTPPLAPILPGDEIVDNNLKRWRQEYGEPPLFNNQIPNSTDDNKNTDSNSLEKEAIPDNKSDKTIWTKGYLIVGKDIESKK